MKGTVRDPDLDPMMTRVRWEVLNLLRGIGRDEIGIGKSLSTTEAGNLLAKVLAEVGADAGRVGQAGRWFARARKDEDNPEWVLYWRNSKPARFGIRPERSDLDVDRLLAAYAGRLAAFALARVEDRTDVEYSIERAQLVRKAEEATKDLDLSDRYAEIVAKAEAMGLPLHEIRKKELAGALIDGPSRIVEEALAENEKMDRGWASAPSAETLREEIEASSTAAEPVRTERDLADAPIAAPLARQENLGLQEQNAVDDRPVAAVDAQFADKDRVSGKPLGAHDPAVVASFVKRFEEVAAYLPRSTILEIFAGFVSICPTGLTADVVATPELVREFASRLSPLEKNNVLLGLADDAARLLRERADDWAVHADPARKPRGETE